MDVKELNRCQHLQSYMEDTMILLTPTMWMFTELFLRFLPQTRYDLGYTFLPTFPYFHWFRLIDLVGGACSSSDAYFPWTPDYTFCLSDLSFFYQFLRLLDGLFTLTRNFFFFPHA